MSRDYGNGGTVCVCTDHHCDTVPPVGKIPLNSYVTYTSNKDGLRFKKNVQKFKITYNQLQKEYHYQECLQEVHVEYEICGTHQNTDKYSGIHQEIYNKWQPSPPKSIIIDRSRTFQEILGFGGAFSDATAINIKTMSVSLQAHLMKSYFSEEGLEYNLCRVPMGATDFSKRVYSYIDSDTNEVNCIDPALGNFELTEEDLSYKIPIIMEANRLTSRKLQLFTSTWVAPKHFKENNNYRGTMGFIKKGLYQLWADYFVKFLDYYKDNGVTFWGITTGNEPHIAMLQFEGIPGVLWYPDDHGQWIRENLVPALRNSVHRNIKVITLDDQRPLLLTVLPKTLANGTEHCVQGVGLHWYLDYDNNTYLLDEFHQRYPDLFLLATEGCTGDLLLNTISLGAWDRAERYAWDIAQDLNHWVTGWVDWNMVLDLDGGPRVAEVVDSPIIFNKTANEFYKQPTYYAMGHFSKFIPRGSVRIYSTQCDGDDLTDIVAFKRPDGFIVVIFVNRSDHQIRRVFVDINRGEIDISASPHSITTILY